MHRFKLGEFQKRHDVTDERFDKLAALIAPAKAGPWLVGGAVRRLLIGHPQDSDFDVAFANVGQLAALKTKLEAAGFKAVKDTDAHVELTGKVDDKPTTVQLLRVTYAEQPDGIIDTFDFTICMFAYDGDEVTCGEWSLWDLARKRLSMHKVTYGAATVRRLTKYAKQGYTFCQGTIVSILEECIAKPEVVRAEVAYVD